MKCHGDDHLMGICYSLSSLDKEEGEMRWQDLGAATAKDSSEVQGKKSKNLFPQWPVQPYVVSRLLLYENHYV